MTTPELLNIRLYNQLLISHDLTEPQEVVSWMGAMQAQALDIAKWGIGVRLGGRTVKDIEEALNTGKVIRTHILRPTWHYVAAEDHRWMFDLSNPQIKPIYVGYCKTVGADESEILRDIPLVEKALSDGKHLTKEEIGDLLESHKIMDSQLVNLILYRAEMEGIICNGRVQGSKQTYTLLDGWVPRQPELCREEALERLARRYFTSHGPASIPDFAWWSGLSITDCRKAVGTIRHDFVCESLNGREFWMRNDIKTPPAGTVSALLLPSFDEFVVSYKDRSEIVRETHYEKVITKNGVFSPTAMLDGEVVGAWKKTIKKKAPSIELSFFEKTPQKIQRLFEPEIKRLKEFYAR